MTYVKLEHRHLGDDRWLDLSPAAFTVHVWALDHCNEQATDGAIPKARAARLVCPVEPTHLPEAWAELVEAGFWADEDDEYVCPEFTAHGISAEEQTAVRQKWAEDKRRQRNHAIGNHQLCTPRSCKAAAASGQVDSSPAVHQWTSGRSDQTRPDQTPKGSGSGLAVVPSGADAPPGTPRDWLGVDTEPLDDDHTAVRIETPLADDAAQVWFRSVAPVVHSQLKGETEALRARHGCPGRCLTFSLHAHLHELKFAVPNALVDKWVDHVLAMFDDHLASERTA